MSAGGDSLRLDKWLWHARFCKTRSLASERCRGGGIRLNGRAVNRPAQPVRAGDSLELEAGGRRHRLRVVALGERRGPAPEARTLYEDLAPPEPVDRWRRDAPGQRPRGAGRPTKAERRAMERLTGRG